MRANLPVVTAFLLVALWCAGSATAGAQPALQFVRFQDPAEGAFSLDVPAGWRVTGGLRRAAPTDVRSCVEAVSPDGRIAIRLKDCDVPTFTVPNATFYWTGFREGSWYSPGWGVQMMVRRYQPGLAFAESYAWKLGAGCRGFAVTERRERPDFARAQPSSYSFAGMQLTAGEVAFGCDRGGEKLAGYVLASTQLVSFPGSGGLWTVDYLSSFVAPAALETTARAALARMAGSLRVNPQWTYGQQAVTANTSRIVAETNEYVTRVQREVYENRQRSFDRIMQKWSDVNRGIVRLRDPYSGYTYEAPAGHNYYWRLPGAYEPFGTDSSYPPAYNAIPMVIQP